MQHFPVDVFQTGSGTSSNMNANEVVATLASRRLGGKVNPNDHVNCGQSSNDIIPSTIHISAALEISERLPPALRHLEQTIQSKAGEVHAYEDRPHPPDGCDAGTHEPGARWLGAAGATGRRAHRERTSCLAAVGTGRHRGGHRDQRPSSVRRTFQPGAERPDRAGVPPRRRLLSP